MGPIWSGSISFGLVSVPVRMFPATESKELRFHFLHKEDLTPIAYEKVRRDDRQPVDPDRIVRGFEIEKGRYVPLEEEDLDRRDIELTHSIDICDFVSLDEIDPVYYRKAYYLLSARGGVPARARASARPLPAALLRPLHWRPSQRRGHARPAARRRRRTCRRCRSARSLSRLRTAARPSRRRSPRPGCGGGGTCRRSREPACPGVRADASAQTLRTNRSRR